MQIVLCERKFTFKTRRFTCEGARRDGSGTAGLRAGRAPGAGAAGDGSQDVEVLRTQLSASPGSWDADTYSAGFRGRSCWRAAAFGRVPHLRSRCGRAPGS